jgi:hypothetical protein
LTSQDKSNDTERRILTPENLTALRAPFPPEQISRRPTIWCRDCRDAPGRVCSRHAKIRCDSATGCGQTITSAHFHLDYVGHADVTDRLLSVDPEWNWEPLAYDDNGLPKFDEHNSLWMRLTLCGKTMICYGSAPGKRGPDAIKEVIGDGIRNGAMRFGVALALWAGKFADMLDADPSTIDTIPDEMAPMAAPANVTQHRRIRELWDALGYVGDANLGTRLSLTRHTLGRDVADERDISCDEAVTMIRVLEARIEAKNASDVKAAKSAKSAKPDTSAGGVNNQ